MRRHVVILIALMLVLAACEPDSSADTTEATIRSAVDAESTTTTSSTTTSSTTTTTTIPAGPPLAQDGDEGEMVEAIQHVLNCTGYGDLTVDGVYGSATTTAIEAAQTALAREVTGLIDEDTFAELSRSCPEGRSLTPDEEDGIVNVVGNTAPGDPEFFTITLAKNDVLTITILSGNGAITVTGADGTEVLVEDQGTYTIPTTQAYIIEVTVAEEPSTFTLSINATQGEAETGSWIFSGDGLTYEGTKLALGGDADSIIDNIYDFLGHGIRGAYEEFDTDWYEIDDPQVLGLRGIYIEGLAFLFFGPSSAEPARPETLERIRFEGPSDDAEGEPRPERYVTTSEGITVGDTLADLLAAYPDADDGSNSEEHFYSVSDAGGTLCFYFGSSEPDDGDTITEIATECRS